MAEDTTHGTAIQWTHAAGFKGETWNPIIAIHKETGKRGWHCEHASRGCDHCYAEAQNKAGVRLGTREAYTRAARDRVDILLRDETLLQPIHWRSPRAIFVCSMTDIFGEWVRDEWLDQIFAVMALTPQHRYYVLTKRAKRMAEYFAVHLAQSTGPLQFSQQASDELDRNFGTEAVEGLAAGGDSTCMYEVPRWWGIVNESEVFKPKPLPNVWLGVTAENQQQADERIPHLLECPAAIRFVSYEPAIGPVNLEPYLDSDRLNPCRCGDGECSVCWSSPAAPTVDWVIVGGESQRGARPFDINWARSVLRQCRDARVPAFVKQLGAKPFDSRTVQLLKGLGSHGAWSDLWPEELKVREFPEVLTV